jgi:hypothetical protein
MALAERQVRETTVQDGDAVQTTRQVEHPVAEQDFHKNVAARVVWFIAGVILVLLGLRFLLALLGANAGSGFVSFVYGITAPLVAPFFGIFNYNFTAGQARFEMFTLLAMLIYALIAYGIAKLVTITSRTA